ncbi:MAG: MFS transporter [Clostridiales bacterium]|nr:MFS transporter [Clostridiales bacterium]
MGKNLFFPRPAKNQNLPAALVQGLYWAMIAAFFSFINAFLLESGYSDIQIGWISTIIYLTSTFAGPLTGYLTDVFIPARRFLFLCFLASVPFVLLVPAVVSSFAAVTCCVVAVTVLQNLVCGVIDSWTMRIREQDRSLSYPMTRSVGSLLFAASAYGVGLLAARFGYRITFAANIVFLVMTLAAMLFLRPVGCPGRDSRAKVGFAGALRELMHCREYVIYIASMICYLFGLRLTLVFQPNLFFSVGGTAADVGAASAIAAVFEVPCILMMTRAKRFAKPVICLAALLIGSVKPLLMLLVPSVGAYLGAQVFQAVSYGFQIAFSLYYIQHITPPRLYATAVMIYTTANMGVACMLASLTGGYMFAVSSTLLLGVSTVFMLLSAAVFSLTFLKRAK